MPKILGVNFGGEILLRASKSWRKKKKKQNNSRKEFAEKFVGDSHKIRQAQIKNSTQIRSVEPWDQNLF